MSVQLLPHIEAIVGTVLREHEDIVALGASVATKTPDRMTRPWIRITRLRAPDRSGIERVIDYMLQLDCYAGTNAMDAHTGAMTVWRLAATTRAILKGLEGTVTGDTVFGRVAITGDLYAPDDAFEPAHDRHVLTVEMIAHG